jgi:uncharacterized protein (DUF58 family)
LPLRRRAWLCREGLYYLAVLAFIVGGAVLRNVNLLVVLAGMMVAPLVLNWRLVMATLRGADVFRRLPSPIFAGEPFTVELVVTNRRRWLSLWLLRVEDRLERISPGDSFGSVEQHSLSSVSQALAPLFAALDRWSTTDPSFHPESVVAEAAGQTTSTVTYRATIPRRGHYRFGPLTLSTAYPLGLVRGHVVFPDCEDVVVLPRIGHLTRRFAELTEADPVGDQRRHPQRGVAEGDYYGLRPWQTGDSQRWIHWRTTAKLGAPTVKQFERQQSRDVAVLLDPWLPLFITEEDIGQLEVAVSVTATIVDELCRRGFGRLSLAIADGDRKAWIAPASPLVRDEVLTALAAVEGRQTTLLGQAIDQLAPVLLSGCRLIVVSPRPQDAPGAAADMAETTVPLDPSTVRWLDDTASDLGDLFSLD